MTPRIGLFHATLNAVAPIVAELRLRAPDAQLSHYVDEGLLACAERDHHGPATIRRLQHWLEQIAADGADAILLTCSAMTPHVEPLRAAFRCPLVAIDEAMIEEAIAAGPRLQIIATIPSAAQTTAELLRGSSPRREIPLSIKTTVVPGAFEQLRAGDVLAHDCAVKAAVLAAIDERPDAIVLAQVSMSRATEGLTSAVPILTSARSAIDRLLAAIDRAANAAGKP